MSVNEVVSLARQHDIPIARENIYHVNKKFDPKLIDDNFYKASVFYYKTTISGRNSIVYLRLTDHPKFIAEIDVKLLGITDRELFTEEMLRILNQKYGQYKKIKDGFFESYEWRPDEFSQIRMRLFGPEASIIYTDLRIKKLLENQRIEKVRKSIKKDSGSVGQTTCLILQRIRRSSYGLEGFGHSSDTALWPIVTVLLSPNWPASLHLQNNVWTA